MQVRPEGETEAATDTVPVKPLTGAIVTVELAETPGSTARLVGFTVMEKSVVAVML